MEGQIITARPQELKHLFIERGICPVCRTDKPTILFSAPYTDRKVMSFVTGHYREQGTVDYSYFSDLEFTVHECRRCALIFQRMAPVGDMLDIIYNQFIDQDRLKASELNKLTLDNFAEISRRLGDLFRRIDKEPKDIQMLDFGCGYGRWARVAVAMGATVYAVEISPEKKRFARSIGVSILSEAEVSDHRFDVIHTEQVFEHLTDPVGVFDQLARCLAPCGVFKIAVPKQGRIRSLLRKRGFIDQSPFELQHRRGLSDYGTIGPLEHLNAFSRKSIELLAERAGLHIGIGSFGARHFDLDFGSFHALASSAQQWGVRLAKDLYVRCGPGIHDNGYYLLFRGQK